MGISAEVAYLFRHAVIRDAAYGLHTPSARARLHGIALVIMQGMPEGQSDAWAEELADHARRGLEADDADRDALLATEFACLLRAAEHETRHWQNQSAVSLRQRIADHPLVTPVQCVQALLGAVETLVRSGRPNEAPELAQRALDVAQEAADSAGAASALAALAQSQSIIGDYSGAAASNQRALAAAREVANPELEARVQVTTAQIAQATGDWAASERAALRALELQGGKEHSRARSLLFVGDSCWQQGRLADAEMHFRSALETYTRTGHLGGEASSRDHLGSLLVEMGRREEGVREHERAASLFSDIGDTLGYGAAISNLASALLDEGRPQESRRYRLKALELFRASGAVYLEGICHGNLAEVERRMGLLESALQRFQRARDLLHRSGRAVEESVFDALFGQMLLLLGFIDAAVTNARQAYSQLTRLETVNWRERYVGVLEVRCAIDRATGGDANAHRAARDRTAQIRQSATATGALARVLELCDALLIEAEKPEPMIYRGHLVTELEPGLRLALLDRAAGLDTAAQRQLEQRPVLLAAMREGTEGLALPDWSREVAP